MARLPERTTSRRLTMRRWRDGDAEVLAEAVRSNLEHLRPWMPWADVPTAPTAAEYAHLISEWEPMWAAGGDCVMGVFHAGHIAGGTGLHRRLGEGGLEIGYWIDVGHVRRGFATEVAAALTDLAFTVDDINRVEIHHDEANVASGRVPAALGYRKIGEVAHPPEAPGETGVRWIWRTTRPDWPAERSVRPVDARPVEPSTPIS